MIVVMVVVSEQPEYHISHVISARYQYTARTLVQCTFSTTRQVQSNPIQSNPDISRTSTHTCYCCRLLTAKLLSYLKF